MSPTPRVPILHNKFHQPPTTPKTTLAHRPICSPHQNPHQCHQRRHVISDVPSLYLGHPLTVGIAFSHIAESSSFNLNWIARPYFCPVKRPSSAGATGRECKWAQRRRPSKSSSRPTPGLVILRPPKRRQFQGTIVKPGVSMETPRQPIQVHSSNK